MVTARTVGEDVVEALAARRQRLRHQTDRLPGALARIETHLAHKRAVSALRDSEERYALAVRGANDGLWDWNLITQQVYWSPRWRSILGLEDTEIGMPIRQVWLSRMHPDDASRVQSALDDHLASGAAGHFESEHRVRHQRRHLSMGPAAAAPRCGTTTAWRPGSRVR